MHTESTPTPLTAASALVALAAVNGMLWVVLARALGGVVGRSPSPPLLTALAVATALAVVIPATVRIAVPTGRSPRPPAA